MGELSTLSTTYGWATHWNGSVFSTQSTPNPTVPAPVELNAVSCASATSCIAVGKYTNTAGVDQTLAEAWNGAQWSIQATPNPGLFDSKFTGVSCPTPTACVAVGSDVNGQLAESWNGMGWAMLATPNVPGASLNAVSCTTASACTAGGFVVGVGSYPLFAERWDGTTWTVQSVPVLAADSSQFNGVSCASATACTAVGEFATHLTTHPLAAAWDGATWTLEPVPSPADALFTSVSCATSSACSAVGLDLSLPTTLGERWDGSNWSRQSIPNPAGGSTMWSSKLTGVSCSSATSCAAVGGSTAAAGRSRVLADVWDGTTWTTQTLPSTKVSWLTAVSCTSSTDCTGVGTGSLGPIAVRSR